MSAPYYIELIGSNEEVLSRHRFEKLPITIGRAYDNELILDDAYMAEHHAEIYENDEGVLEIKDLGSKNGIISQNLRLAKTALDGLQILKLGRTRVRVRDVNFTVDKELIDHTTSRWEGLPPALTGLAMITASTLLSTWLLDFEQARAVSYIYSIMIVFALVITWCGVWAFASRVMSGHARFGRHIFIAASAIILMDCWDALSHTAAYVFSLETLTRYGSHILVAIAGGMIFSHLYVINPKHPKHLFKISLVIAMLGSCVILMNNYLRDGSLADELYMSHLLPPATRLSGNQSTSDFLDEAKTLKAHLDSERLKPANMAGGLIN